MDALRPGVIGVGLCLVAALCVPVGGCSQGADRAASASMSASHAATGRARSVPTLRIVPPQVKPVSRPPRRTPALSKPAIIQDPIPFPQSRKREMTLYAQRHYGIDSYRLIDPHVIVEHYTETGDLQSTYQIFAPDHPDSELHELPNTCAHFVVERDGTIYQLVSPAIMCRHTVGLNYTAIGIENVGYSDQEILDNNAEVRSSLALTRWLRCRYGISIDNVIGHNESLSSPYHHEDIPSLRTQTHEDWRRADMDVYRAMLRRLPCN
ncbi:MAG TPA: peptidoglycan recognition family protein [Solirubrobacteraceae bacterium]|nr:peptidoglycan recognition family protein [Solirubrobacteraceae bacterium]